MAIDIVNTLLVDSASDLKIYENERSFRVFAGPGAGKTYLLIENIKTLVKNSLKLKKNGRKILCITYTNAAADEIIKRLGVYNQYVYVSTIHSFLYDVVLKNNRVQLRHQIQNKYGIEISDSVSLKPRIEGMSPLATCKKEKLHEYLVSKGMDQTKVEGLSKTKIGQCIWKIDILNTYPFNDSNIVTIHQDPVFSDDEIKIIKSSILEVAQELDFDEILFWGYTLIKEYKHIRYSLRYKFPYVFVDEYQDTNPIQNATLRLFADDKNVVWGVIGDLVQSIYGFNNATYKEFENFQTTDAQIDYKIDGNRRSTDNIIKFCSYFRQKDPVIPNQICAKNTSVNNKVKIVLHTGLEEPNSIFVIDNETAILCRSAAEVFSFTNIDTEQKRALKKIANTYEFGGYGLDMLNAIDQGREEWLRLCKFLVQLKVAKEKNSLAEIISACRGIIDIEKITKSSKEQGYYYKNLIILIKKIDEIIDSTTMEDIENIINESLKSTNMLIRDCFLIPKEGDEYYNKDIHDNVRLLTYETIKKMILEVYSFDSKIMTIHKAKGLEFKKVIVGIEPFSKEDISKKNGYIDKLAILKSPIVLSQEEDTNPQKSNISEYTRIIYVGLSRAINDLTLYVRLNLNQKDAFRTEFDNALKEYMRVNYINEPFYEFVEI
ncbi:MAG: ATP-dependent helicase [Firmicutes bacterium]|nr:ATP-dependent helicase [Bacillota bacterium]